MKKGKKVTYIDLLVDESIHKEYERALEKIGPELGNSHPLFIGGKEIYSAPEFEVRSPFDKRILVGKFQTATPNQIRTAINTAKKGFLEWKDLNWNQRVKIIQKSADIIDSQKFLLSALITYETGKNRYEAIAEVSEAVDMLRYHVDIYKKNKGFIVPMKPEQPKAKCRSVMRPYGAWAVISPFNFPLSLAAGMVGAALITGNSVVLKPTSLAPYSALKLYKALITAGFPPAGIQYITGPGEIFGNIITGNPNIDGIAFTGSREVGLFLHRAFTTKQPYPKPVITETGSKNPVIVTERADLKKAVSGVVKSSYGYSGQKCSATSRVYVHISIADQFVKALVNQIKTLVIGDPRNKDTSIGPLIDANAMKKYRDAVDQVKKDGGKIVIGGEVIANGNFFYGNYVQPTVVTQLTRGHPLQKRELFIPFVIVEMVSTLQEAMIEANNTEYGLTAGIFSEDRDEVDYFFDNIQFGVAYANRRGGATTGAWPGSQSFVGWKGSSSTGKGIGGPYYLLSYMREQTQTKL